jgi:hypothetical protein
MCSNISEIMLDAGTNITESSFILISALFC